MVVNKGEIIGIAQDIIFIMNSPTSEEGKLRGLGDLIKQLEIELEKAKK